MLSFDKWYACQGAFVDILNSLPDLLQGKGHLGNIKKRNTFLCKFVNLMNSIFKEDL
jgi:hypothetical protein